ncbi:MAG: DUF3800 domain-containing protein [Lachnospiraceae bacterium]|nr:DUF3800 domain-containing protein [Lachnospiraceae bacterium]
MRTTIVYFDETGDDGNNQKSSDHFILTSFYMPAELWKSNFQLARDLRNELRNDYGFKIKEEMHTKQFLTNKNPYAGYEWTDEVRKDIVLRCAYTISKMEGKAINVIIDKRKILNADYQVLDRALTYNLQRIENDSNRKWNYLVITDEGRLAPMRQTARRLQVFNPIPSHYQGAYNQPLNMMIEDILEKNSSESYFIQVCDFISYFVHLYFLSTVRMRDYPRRIDEM